MLIRTIGLLLFSASLLTACKSSNKGFNKQKYTKLKKINTEVEEVEKSETTADDIAPYEQEKEFYDTLDATINEEPSMFGIEASNEQEQTDSFDKFNKYENHTSNRKWDNINIKTDESFDSPLDASYSTNDNIFLRNSSRKLALKLWGFWIILFGTILLIILYLIESRVGNYKTRLGFVISYWIIILTTVIASTYYFIVGSNEQNRNQSSFNAGRFWLVTLFLVLGIIGIIAAALSVALTIDVYGSWLTILVAILGIALAIYCIIASVRLIKHGSLRKK